MKKKKKMNLYNFLQTLRQDDIYKYAFSFENLVYFQCILLDWSSAAQPVSEYKIAAEVFVRGTFASHVPLIRLSIPNVLKCVQNEAHSSYQRINRCAK